MSCALPIVDLWIHLEQSLTVLMREQEDGLGGMSNHPRGQARLVIVDERDHVSARNVAMIDDGEPTAIEIELDADHLSRWDARADGSSVQKTRKDEVVHITCCAGCLCNTLFSEDISPDGPDATHSADYRRKRNMSGCAQLERRMTKASSALKKQGNKVPRFQSSWFNFENANSNHEPKLWNSRTSELWNSGT